MVFLIIYTYSVLTVIIKGYQKHIYYLLVLIGTQ